MINILRTFTTSAAMYYRPNHSLFTKVDWDRVNGGQYAIVDPADDTGILYLSEKDYKIQVRVSLSQDLSLIVLARPGDTKEQPSRGSSSSTSQNSPLYPPVEGQAKLDQSKGAKRSKTATSGTITDSLPKDLKQIPNVMSQFDTLLEEMSGTRGKPTKPLDLSKISLADLDKIADALADKDEDFHLNPRFWELRDESKRRSEGIKGFSQFFKWYLSSLSSLKTENRGELGTPMVAITRENVLSLIVRWGTILNFRLGGPLVPTRSLRSALVKLAVDLAKVHQTRGRKALIMKMKNSKLFIEHYLSGTTPKDPWLLGEPVSLARSGLPRIIPLVIRRRIAAGDHRAIMLMESIFSAYKALLGPYEDQDLASIRGPHPVIESQKLEEFERFCKEVFWPQVNGNLRRVGKADLIQPELKYPDYTQPYIPLRAGPNESVGLLGAHKDALAWDSRPLYNPLLMWAKHVGDEKLQATYSQTLQWAKNWYWSQKERSSFLLGKIALLQEPAGKVRAIAIVDYWTQRAMYPVHQWMMKVLDTLPGDCTFDQDAGVRSFASLCKGKVYSIDLKSATDLIPLDLYRVLFSAVWGEETCNLWLLLLTDRWFGVPKTGVSQDVPSEIEYGRGQPMGTLSSWASMALVHHALALYAAWKSGHTAILKFQEYRVLGDDIVIGEQKVAEEYLDICRSLHVPTSIPKTLVGHCFIFASQVFYKGVSISPMSLREELGIRSSSQRIEMALRAVSRGWLMGKETIASFLRHLIRRENYVRSVKFWRQGKLGSVCQAALTSALGVGGRVLHNLGFRESKFQPFLFALQNKVQALVGSQRGQALRESTLVRDLKFGLSIVLIRSGLNLCRERFEALMQSRIRWSDWLANMQDPYVLPKYTRGLLPEGIAPSKSWARVRGYKPDHTNTLFVYGDQSEVDLFYYQSIWPVIKDSYELFFGIASQDSSQTDYTLYEAEDLGVGVEDLGMGVTFTADQFTAAHPSGHSIRIPTVQLKCSEIIDNIEAKLKLVLDAANNPEDPMDPLVLVDEVFEEISSIPRVPTFESLESLRPSRDPKDVDAMRAWVRQVKSMEKVLNYLPLCKTPEAGHLELFTLHELSILDACPTYPHQEKN